tara:strand:- start:209 stop:673 length:465 start_codon:yes stop_codon:yes gene_type:complete
LRPRADGGFIFLNTLLLHAMHRRSAWQTRCCIAGTVAFALITITLLALFIIHKVLDDDSPDDDDSVSVATVASWTLRGVLVAFYAAMAHNCASAPSNTLAHARTHAHTHARTDTDARAHTHARGAALAFLRHVRPLRAARRQTQSCGTPTTTAS